MEETPELLKAKEPEGAAATSAGAVDAKDDGGGRAVKWVAVNGAASARRRSARWESSVGDSVEEADEEAEVEEA